MGSWSKNAVGSLVLVAALCSSPLFFAPSVSGDGGFIPQATHNVYEPGQNAIICWNGTHERMFLSVNINADGDTEGLHVVPFPSLPSVGLGNISIFKNVTDVFNYGEYYGNYGGFTDSGGEANALSSIVIEYSNIIGSHEIIVIRATDPEDFKDQIEELLRSIGIPLQMWPQDLTMIVANYLERDICYFALDRFPVSEEVGAMDPLIYDFETDYLIFPLEISSMLTGTSEISITVMAPDDLPIDLSKGIGQISYRLEKILGPDQLDEIDRGLRDMMEGRTSLGFFFNSHVTLSELKDDFIIEKNNNVNWMRASPSMTPQRIGSQMGMVKERALFYSYDPEKGSKDIVCADTRTGEVLWSSQPSKVVSDEITDRQLVVDDLDDDLVQDIIVIDRIGSKIWMARLHGLTGTTEWLTFLPTEANQERYYYINYHGTIKNGDGRPFPMFSAYGLYRPFIIDPENGKLVWDTQDLGVQMDEYFTYVMSFDGPAGDRVFFLNNNRPTMWDPWNETNEVVWTKSDGFFNAMKGKIDGEDFLFMMDPDHFHVFDPEDGGTKALWNLDGIQGTMNKLIPDSDGDDCDEGYFIREGSYKTVNKVCLKNGTVLWHRHAEFPIDGSYFNDFNGDGALDIGTTYWLSGYNYPDQTNFLEIMDGRNGVTIWNRSNAYTLLLGSDLDGDSLLEEVALKNQSLIVTEIASNQTILDMRVQDPEDRIRTVLMSDFNSDGWMDLVLNRDKSIEFIDVKDGATIDKVKVSGETYRSISTIPSGPGKSTIVYQQGYRYYSISAPYWLEIGADKREVNGGENLTVFVNLMSDLGPVTGATVEWRASTVGGTFSGTIESLPGIYSTSWTAPKDYQGTARITAVVNMAGSSPREIGIDITVWNGLIYPNGQIEALIFDAWAFKDVVTEGSDINILVNVDGDIDPALLDVQLIDPKAPDANVHLTMLSGGLWGLSYPVVAGPGDGYVLIRVLKGNLILWEEFIDFIVLPVPDQDAPDHTAISIVRCIVAPEAVEPGGIVFLLIMLDGANQDDQIYIDVRDGNAHGIFGTLEKLSAGFWRTDYEPTISGGVVELTIDVYKDFVPVDRAKAQVYVLEREEMDLLKDPLMIEYSIDPEVPSTSKEFDVFIHASFGGEIVTDLNYILIGVPSNWYIEEINESAKDSMHLFVHRPELVNGSVYLLLYDREGRGNVLRIDFTVEKETTSPGPEGSDDPDDQGAQGTRRAPISIALVVVFFIITASISMVAIVVALNELEKRKFGSRGRR